MKRFTCLLTSLLFINFLFAQQAKKGKYGDGPDDIPVGPIVVMIENYRTGLLWKLFMKITDIQNGLKKLGFSSPWIKN